MNLVPCPYDDNVIGGTSDPSSRFVRIPSVIFHLSPTHALCVDCCGCGRWRNGGCPIDPCSRRVSPQPGMLCVYFLNEGSPMDRFHWYSLSYIEALRVHICRTESTDVQEQGDLRIVRKEMGFHVIALGGSSSRISYYPIFTHSVKKRRFLWSYL